MLDDAGYLYVWSMISDILTLYCLDTKIKGEIVWTKTITGQTSYPDAVRGAGDRLYILCSSADISGVLCMPLT